MRTEGWRAGIALTFLAVVFTIGLTFASLELPAVLHGALVDVVPANEGDSHADEASLRRTELFMSHYHLRLIGYVCFTLMMLLIIAGFALGRRGPAVAGALLLFLPVFAQFAGVMFFLAGLGVLNLVWLPVLDVSFAAGQLGDIVYLPYRLLHWLFAKAGVDIFRPLVLTVLGAGLLVFLLGTLAWLLARFKGRKVADFWLYRFSRHPQYLGWIVWTYGMLLLLTRVSYPKRSWGLGASLPWLIATMVILGVALMEEGRMKRSAGASYEGYQGTAPFLLPLPKFIAEPLTLPSRLLFGKRLPEKGGEIVAILTIYTLVLVGLSAVYVRARALPLVPDAVRAELPAEASTAEAYIRAVKLSDNWHGRRPYAVALGRMGEEAVEPLIELLRDPDPALREVAAVALGEIGSRTAVEPLIGGLTDPEGSVRYWVVASLGQLRAEEAVEPLVVMLADDARGVRSAVAGALATIGSREAVEPLIEYLDDPSPWTRATIAYALGELGSEQAVEPLLATLDIDDQDVNVRRAVIVALGQINSPRSDEALRRALDDQDAEVRRYAAEALKR